VDPAFTWDQPRPPTRQRVRSTTPSAASSAPRITLREAEHRFGVSVATLRTWARKKAIDAVMTEADAGRQWMVTPESVAHHLSRAPRPAPRPAKKVGTRSAPPRAATGPTGDGTAMLVPRDAWDRLMDQLGNLHEAGLLLAAARERAAKAETEAGFLRERLAELRAERDELRVKAVREATSSETPRRRRFFGYRR
jgi:DNA-binding transcriptional MerR regulator